jgi:hypothetical protein
MVTFLEGLSRCCGTEVVCVLLHVMRAFYKVVLANFLYFLKENTVFLCNLSHCTEGACQSYYSWVKLYISNEKIKICKHSPKFDAPNPDSTYLPLRYALSWADESRWGSIVTKSGLILIPYSDSSQRQIKKHKIMKTQTIAPIETFKILIVARQL